MSAHTRVCKPSALSLPPTTRTQETDPSLSSHNGAQNTSYEDIEDKIEAFPITSLPPVAREMASAIANAERIPPALAACCVLGILSASIGSQIQIHSGPNRFTRGNLYIVASAESGSGKSETFRHAVRPFFDWERRRLEIWYKETLPKVEARRDILEALIQQVKKGVLKAEGEAEIEKHQNQLQKYKAELIRIKDECERPAMFSADITTERLAVLLGLNGEQLSSLSADAGDILNNILGRYNKLARTDESVYLKAFSGDQLRVDRQGRDPVLLHRPCLSALWLVQPDKIESLLAAQSLMDGGLIPRLLICHTQAQARPIEDGATGIASETSSAWTVLIETLLRTIRFRAEPLTIEPSPEALKRMNTHHNEIVGRRRTDLKDVAAFAARWNEQAWRIAVCLHAALYGERAGEVPLELSTAEAAIVIADWFAGEQLRILSRVRMATQRKQWDEVLKVLIDHTEGSITARLVQRARITPDADRARALLAEMESAGLLVGSDTTPPSGGHAIRTYRKR